MSIKPNQTKHLVSFKYVEFRPCFREALHRTCSLFHICLLQFFVQFVYVKKANVANSSSPMAFLISLRFVRYKAETTSCNVCTLLKPAFILNNPAMETLEISSQFYVSLRPEQFIPIQILSKVLCFVFLFRSQNEGASNFHCIDHLFDFGSGRFN